MGDENGYQGENFNTKLAAFNAKNPSGQNRQNADYADIVGSKDSETLVDEFVPKSLGAKWRNYGIAYDGKIYNLVEGGYLREKQVIAGKGVK